jgi:UDP-N-acetylglucosamine:LPS N-acetylglucosamine transferase
MKICLVCSHGGHLTETLQLLPALVGHDYFIATYHSARDLELEQVARVYFTQNIGHSIWKMTLVLPWVLRLLKNEVPDVVLSLGAEIAIPFFFLGKLLGIRTIYIESWCRVENLSLTGRLVYPIADEFWVQWPGLLAVVGRKASFHGAVV